MASFAIISIASMIAKDAPFLIPLGFFVTVPNQILQGKIYELQENKYKKELARIVLKSQIPLITIQKLQITRNVQTQKNNQFINSI